MAGRPSHGSCCLCLYSLGVGPSVSHVASWLLPSHTWSLPVNTLLSPKPSSDPLLWGTFPAGPRCSSSLLVGGGSTEHLGYLHYLCVLPACALRAPAQPHRQRSVPYDTGTVVMNTDTASKRSPGRRSAPHVERPGARVQPEAHMLTPKYLKLIN